MDVLICLLQTESSQIEGGCIDEILIHFHFVLEVVIFEINLSIVWQAELSG